MAYGFMLAQPRLHRAGEQRSEVTKHRGRDSHILQSHRQDHYLLLILLLYLQAPKSLSREDGIRCRRTESTVLRNLGTKDKMQQPVCSLADFEGC